NREAAKRDAAKMDWSFTVWQPANWERLRKMPPDLNPTDPADAKNGPPAQIDVFCGGNIKWADVAVPKGLRIVDNRMEAHGFKGAEGVVVEGKVIDLVTKKRIAAKVRLQNVQPPKDGQADPARTEAAADAQGHWVLKNAPAGSHQIVIEAEGYVARI